MVIEEEIVDLKYITRNNVFEENVDYFDSQGSWFIVKDCQMIKKWVNHFPDGNSHLKAE